ncbi:MAG: hypothetical protein CMI09_06145 [Oceanospirillaceae bacterium]|nr:hypothetical protein [Oceanospirillaceae bacterium]
MRINYPILLTSLVTLLGMSSHGQAASQEQLDDYQRWLQGTQQEFRNYLDANDKAFLSFLNQKWEEVDVQKPDVRDPKPKPPTMPVAQPKPAPVATPITKPTLAPEPAPAPTPVAKPEPIQQPVPGPQQKPVEKPVSKPPVAPVPAPVVTKGPKAKFEFFGQPVVISYPRKFRANFRKPLKEKQIARYWQTLASENHQPIIKALDDTAKRLMLNDWGKALLIDQFSRALHRDKNSQALTSWFLLVKSGFDARIAYDKRVYLLLSSKQSLYGVTFFTLDGRPYYALGLNEQIMPPGQVYTYKGQHDAGRRPIDFSQPYRFAVTSEREHRDLAFRYGGQSYQLNIDYPKSYVRYLKDYPQLALPNYFSAGLPPETAKQLLNQLRPMVQGVGEQEAVNRLLRFVQTAFEYATDKQQFNEENYLFPLETLHYPYSDCEDRAALFAWLTRELLGLEVMIVEYPGHVATAVAFTSDVKGTAWDVNNRRYTIADPTYINADAGMVMPDYARARAKLKPF